MTLDQDEQLLVDALHRTTFTPPDLSATALRATRLGTRLRRRHQAGRRSRRSRSWVSESVGRRSRPAATAASHRPVVRRLHDAVARRHGHRRGPRQPTPSAAPTTRHLERLRGPRAPGWTAPDDNVIADEKLYYAQDGTDAGVSLNWRPSTLGPKYTEASSSRPSWTRGTAATSWSARPPSTATRPTSSGTRGMFTVVGPIKQGRFLTLSASGVTLEQITELATHVHRQKPEHLAGQPQ